MKIKLLGPGIIVLINILILGSVELILRLCDVGTDPHLIQQVKINGDEYLYLNKIYTLQYIGAENVLIPAPNEELFKKDKVKGQYRIFVLGESTSRGFPYSRLESFPKQLQQMLNNAALGEKIEVINFSIDATNSYTGCDIAKEIVKYPPDMAIIYYGHNEFIGIGGSGQSHKVLFKANKFFYKFRIYQYIKNLIIKHTKKNDASLIERMANKQLIEYNSPLYKNTINDFKHNYEEILSILKAGNIKVIACGVARNLKDFRPLNDIKPGNDVLQEFDNLIKTGDETGIKNKLESYIKEGKNIYFGLGQFFLSKQKNELAKMCFLKSCDLDNLRLRASTDINDNIELLSKKYGSTFVDLQLCFDQDKSDGIAGNELFLEHVHPTFEGHNLIARKLSDVMIKDVFAARPAKNYSQVSLFSNIIEDIAVTKILRNLYTSFPLSKVHYFNIKGFEKIYYSENNSLEGLKFKNDSLALQYSFYEPYFQKYNSLDQIHLRMGVNYINSQKIDLAYREFSLAYGQNPLNVSALNNMAIIRFKLGNKQTAIEMQQMVCGLSPDYNIGLINIWLMYKSENMQISADEVQKKLKKSHAKLSANSTFIIDDF
jgi:lysophospholipase L1-like esterase